jgi:hypothetical protein
VSDLVGLGRMAAVSRLRSTMMKLGRQGGRMAWARPMGYAAQASMEEEVWREPSRPVEAMHSQEKDRGVQWVFLGCPGVGKGTYASRLAKLLEVPHIAMGDLVRNEILQKTTMAEQVCWAQPSSAAVVCAPQIMHLLFGPVTCCFSFKALFSSGVCYV